MRSFVILFALIASVLFVRPALADPAQGPVAVTAIKAEVASIVAPSADAAWRDGKAGPNLVKAKVLDVARQAGPSGKYAWVGALVMVPLALLALMVVKYLPAGLEQAGAWLNNRKRLILWTVPAAVGTLYVIFQVLPMEPAGVAQWLAIMLSLFVFTVAEETANTYPEYWSRIKPLVFLGFSTSLVGPVYFALYFAVLAWVIPGTLTGALAVIVAAIAFSMLTFYGTQYGVGRTGRVRGTTVIGHLIAASLALMAPAVMPYDARYLALVLQVYFSLVLSVTWALLWDDIADYDPEQHAYVPLFRTRAFGPVSMAPFALSIPVALLGYPYAAGIFGVLGIFLVWGWLNRRK